MSKKLTKEEFLAKLKTDTIFNKKYGRKDVTEGKQVLPPCHYGFQCYVRDEKYLSLMYNTRSQDVPLGTPFNIASYALLLVIISKMVNMVPDKLIANMGDCHIYLNQIEGVKEQLRRKPLELPTLVISDEVNFTGTIDDFLNSCNKDSFTFYGYESHPTIKIPLSN